MHDDVSLKVWGEFALFSRPDLRVERLSYPLMTPSAARGVLDAILFRPQMRWRVRRITALVPNFPSEFPDGPRARPYRLVGVRRNEIQGKISSRNVEKWIRENSGRTPYLVDSAGRDGAQGENRTQRNSLILQHVAYRIDATPVLTERANEPRRLPAGEEEPGGPDTLLKYAEMFRRRVRKGQCFHHPYLGCREFACHFAESDGAEAVLDDWDESLGLMLFDIRFGPDGVNRPGFFEAKVRRGVLHCDTDGTGPEGEPPVIVRGWDPIGGTS
ncbi:MAG: type I-C CRISPR-associated protein Cas5c [Isosphaeraceae bacterium]